MSQSGVAERVGQWQSGVENASDSGGVSESILFLYLFIRLFIHSFIYLIEPDGLRGSGQARAALPSLGSPIRGALDQALSKMKDIMISQKAPFAFIITSSESVT